MEREMHWMSNVGVALVAVQCVVFLVIHYTSTRPTGQTASDVIVKRASPEFAKALRCELDTRNIQQAIEQTEWQPPVSNEAITIAGDLGLVTAPAAEGKDEIDCTRIPGMKIGGIYSTIIMAVAFLLVYGFYRLLPGISELLLFPLFIAVLIGLFYLVIIFVRRFFGLRLLFDSRVMVFGPLWARKEIPFTEIMAIQVLQDLRQGVNPFQINLVLKSSKRHAFCECKDSEKAMNVANALSDMVKAPIVEQMAASTRA